MKRVLICGGRDYGRLDQNRILEHPLRRAQRNRLCEVLGKLAVEFGTFQVIHGGAKGADALADKWVRESRGFPKPLVFEAQWQNITRPGAVIKYRKGDGVAYDALAGPYRNTRMLEEGRPDLVIAFAGGTGTANMVQQSRAFGVEVREIP